MTETLAKRKTLLAELFPWDDATYGIDERWARFYPYGQKTKPGRTARISLKILNHSEVSHKFMATLHLPSGFSVPHTVASINVGPRTEGHIDYDLQVDAHAEPGTYVLTADVEWGPWKLVRWTEALVEVE